MYEEAIVSSIAIALYMPNGKGSAVFKDRPNHGLVFNFGCTASYTFDTGEELILNSGECLYLPKGSNYFAKRLDYVDGNNHGVYAINFSMLNDQINRPWIRKIKRQDEMLALFSRAAREWTKKSDGYYEECMSDLYRIIRQLKTEAAQSAPSKSNMAKISPAIEYIRENYTTDSIKIAHLADLCGISEVALRKQFQKAFDLSPAVYVRNMRIKYAKELMRNRDASIADVAMLSGFNDISYFSREFKKAEGVSPKEYLSLHQS